MHVVPADTGVTITGAVTTGSAGSDYSVDVTRRHGTNEIVLSGSLPADNGPDDEWVTVDDPARATANVLAAALRRHGVHVLGRTPVARTTPAGARPVASHDSATLGDLLVPFLKLSNNGIAEHLVKEMGRVKADDGSWAAGLAQIGDFLHSNALDTTPARQADGSGLSRYDLVTADRYTALLSYARHQPWFSTWYEALPIAGNPDRLVGGTLAGRMQGTPAQNNVHAKTGSMSGVDTIAGYVTAPDGRKLAFTVLLNNFAGARPRSVIDQIAVRLAGGPQRPRRCARRSTASPAPRPTLGSMACKAACGIDPTAGRTQHAAGRRSTPPGGRRPTHPPIGFVCEPIDSYDTEGEQRCETSRRSRGTGARGGRRGRRRHEHALRRGGVGRAGARPRPRRRREPALQL
ncbi:hypothetical protein GCM10025734_02680 [Kitasatospora paranensis]